MLLLSNMLNPYVENFSRLPKIFPLDTGQMPPKDLNMVVYLKYTMVITTVKLHKRTKSALDELKGDRESYDEVIGKLVSRVNNRNLKSKLEAGYKESAKEASEVLDEWETASTELEND
jgi:hypothetical protein